MQLIKKTKKGFTLVELIVVIAIVAILAAVSVVSYIAFINKGNESADIQLVKQLNTCLQADEALNDGKARSTPTEMLEIMEENGFIIENLTKTKSGYDIVWDQGNNRFALLNNFEKVYVDDTYGNDKTKKQYTWFFVDNIDEAKEVTNNQYGIFLSSAYKDDETDLTVKSSVDTGDNNITNLTYENKTSTAQEVLIVTNSTKTNLIINAINSLDDAKHLGNVGSVLIKKIGTQCYYEYGKVDYDINIKVGKLIMKEGSSAKSILIDTTAEDFDSEANIVVDNTNSQSTPIVIRRNSGTEIPSNVDVAVEQSVSNENVVYADDVATLIALAAEGNKTIKLNQGIYEINANGNESGTEQLVINDNVKIYGVSDDTGNPLTEIKINRVEYNDGSRVLIKGVNSYIEGINFTGYYPNKYYYSVIRLYGNDCTLVNCKSEDGFHAFACGQIHNLNLINCYVANSEYFIYQYAMHKGIENKTETVFYNSGYEETGKIYIKNSYLLNFGTYVFNIGGEGSFVVENSDIMVTWTSVGSVATLTFNNCRILYNSNSSYNHIRSYQMVIFNDCYIDNGIGFDTGDSINTGFTFNNTYYNNILMTKNNYRNITPEDSEWDSVSIIIINGERVQ